MRPDPNASALLQACVEDAGLGRMSMPRPLAASDLGKFTLSPRFGVVQGEWSAVAPCCASYAQACAGTRPDGSDKVRPIDDMSTSGINDATAVSEKLYYDTLDKYVVLLRELQKCAQAGFCVWVGVACRHCIPCGRRAVCGFTKRTLMQHSGAFLSHQVCACGAWASRFGSFALVLRCRTAFGCTRRVHEWRCDLCFPTPQHALWQHRERAQLAQSGCAAG